MIVPVIKTSTGEDRVCQRCLIRWARARINEKVYCFRCFKIEEKGVAKCPSTDSKRR